MRNAQSGPHQTLSRFQDCPLGVVLYGSPAPFALRRTGGSPPIVGGRRSRAGGQLLNGGQGDDGEGTAHLFCIISTGSLSTSIVQSKTIVSLLTPLFQDLLKHFFQHPSPSTHSGDLALTYTHFFQLENRPVIIPGVLAHLNCDSSSKYATSVYTEIV